MFYILPTDLHCKVIQSERVINGRILFPQPPNHNFFLGVNVAFVVTVSKFDIDFKHRSNMAFYGPFDNRNRVWERQSAVVTAAYYK